MQSLRQGLVGAWCPSLGATGYTLLDRSGRNNHGTLTNMGGQSNWQPSGSGGLALNFDGTNDYVNLGNPTLVSGNLNLSVSLWWRTTTSGTTKAIIAKSLLGGVSGRWWLFQNATNMELDASNTAGTGVSTVAVSMTPHDGSWHHAAIVLTPPIMSLTIDGATTTSTASGVGTIAQTAYTLLLAAYNDGSGGASSPSNFYLGQIDDVRIYNRAITLSEIRLLASRRGIGLMPQRRPAATFPTTMYLNVGGVWKPATPSINVAGTWKTATPSINVGGVWK